MNSTADQTLILDDCFPAFERGLIRLREEARVYPKATNVFQQSGAEFDVQGEGFPMVLKDEQLVARAQDGDRLAAEELYNRYQKKAHAIAYHMCLGDKEEARDLTQESFLKAFRNLKDFRQKSSFYTWLYRIVVNTCLDGRRRRLKWERIFPFLRSNKQGKEQVKDDVEDFAGSGDSFDPMQAVSGQQLSKAVREALTSLPLKQQMAFQLKVFQGMTIPEIAQVMGSAEGTVKSHLFRATQFLREALKEWTVS